MNDPKPTRDITPQVLLAAITTQFTPDEREAMGHELITGAQEERASQLHDAFAREIAAKRVWIYGETSVRDAGNHPRADDPERWDAS